MRESEPDELKRRALRALDTGEVARLCSALVRAPSENPPGDVFLAAETALSWLSERGHKVAVHEPEKGRVNLLARVGDGRPCLALMGHLDVVPAGDRGRWSFDPFCGEIQGGRILGRGATDMKGGVACIMAVFHALSGLVDELGGSLVLALVCDEETGGHLGTGWLVRQGLLSDVDACLIAEPTTPYMAVLGERGVCWLRLRARGRPAHGSVPSLGLNAIELMMDALRAIKELSGPVGELPDDVSHVLTEMRERRSDLKSILGLSGDRLEAYLTALCSLTINIGVVRGGTKVNIVPDECEAEVDVRIPWGSSAAGVLEMARRALSTLAEHVEIGAANLIEPSFTRPAEAICQVLDAAAEEVLGRSLAHALMPATTDAHYLRALGVPTVVYGPGLPRLAHSHDEWVPVRHLELASRVICLTAIRFLSAGGAGD